MKLYNIPPCLYEPDYHNTGGDCGYEKMEYECDLCICVTSMYDDYSGIDPQTNDRFNIQPVDIVTK